MELDTPMLAVFRENGLNLKRRTPMKKKPPIIRLANPKAAFQSSERSWHNGGDIEIGLYARSLHKAAKTLIANLNLEPNSKTAWDASPAILPIGTILAQRRRYRNRSLCSISPQSCENPYRQPQPGTELEDGVGCFSCHPTDRNDPGTTAAISKSVSMLDLSTKLRKPLSPTSTWNRTRRRRGMLLLPSY